MLSNWVPCRLNSAEIRQGVYAKSQNHHRSPRKIIPITVSSNLSKTVSLCITSTIWQKQSSVKNAFSPPKAKCSAKSSHIWNRCPKLPICRPNKPEYALIVASRFACYKRQKQQKKTANREISSLSSLSKNPSFRLTKTGVL